MICKNDFHVKIGEITYPLGSVDPEQTLFVGDISPYKSCFGKYPTPDKTIRKINTGKHNMPEVKEWLDLNTEDRMRRTWKSLGLGVRWRATVLAGILSEKRYYSLPVKSNVEYWIIASKMGVWSKLKELDYKVLVSEQDSEWLKRI
jgi:hypothetical protein